MFMYQDLIDKKKKLAVIGLGYVGLPIALEFAKKIKVIGFDIHAKRVEMMKNKIDPSGELEAEAFEGTDIVFTDNLDVLREAQFFIVAVPTPIDEHAMPDLKPLLSASKTVGKVLKKGDYVVYESTVYPGCTEEDCIPVLEAESGLKFPHDFKVGYSPERINPGDKEHTLTKIVKVVSGCDAESSEEIAKTYELVVEAGVHRASSIKVAEAAKIIENTQRDVNIALMNELSLIFDRLNINTYEVLEAAGTKWNFLKFSPGLVGGHCIGVDPYYLTHKAESVGYHPQVILAGRRINNGMGKFVAEQTMKRLGQLGRPVNQLKVIVLGLTFKENVPDLRNSKVPDIIKELQEYGVQVLVHDPLAESEEAVAEYGLHLSDWSNLKDADGIVLAVAHRAYVEMGQQKIVGLLRSGQQGVAIDVKSIVDQATLPKTIAYWRL